jgi:hypothetical protein
MVLLHLVTVKTKLERMGTHFGEDTGTKDIIQAEKMLICPHSKERRDTSACFSDAGE